LTILLGVAVLLLRTPLERWSFDIPHAIQPEVSISNVALVFMDDRSHTDLQQPYDGPWDRKLHAQLVQTLTRAGAKAIAFDDLFTDPGTNAASAAALAAAIRAHGLVVLGADLGSGDYYGLSSETRVILPHPNLLAAASNHWGFVQLKPDADDAVREHFNGWEDVPSLSWELASLLGAPATKERNGQRKDRALNYYGPRGTVPGLSFYKVVNSTDPAVLAFFRDRVVFVGSATQSGFSGKRRDQFKSPYSGLAENLWPGVEFHAIQFLNLMRGDWLRRFPPQIEVGVVLLCGLAAGLGLSQLRPVTATLCALAGAVIIATAACVLLWQTHNWFAWMVIVAAQLPVALAFSIIRSAQRASVMRPIDLTTDFAPAGAPITVPDHEMLRRIAAGSYGEVWLARSVTGTFRAIKIVDRKSSNDPRFEREFTGLKKFEPISRAHEGLVDILHVGRNDTSGQLYYVMELADSCGADPDKDPDGYVAATLKTKILSRRFLDAAECERISLALTSALAFLHEQGLLHRDIKPTNIIFVQGQPKLADIGLVVSSDDTNSFVGTQGFIPPEGPGTPAADVYALGKVLEELVTGTDTAPNQQAGQLRRVIQQACARSAADRYPTATEMLEALRSALAPTTEPKPSSTVL